MAEHTQDGYVDAQDWYLTGYEAEKAVDGSTVTLWSGDTSEIPSWFSICFPYKAVIDRIIIKARSTPNHNQAPTDFTIEASDTGAFGGEEDTLDTISGISWTSSEVKTFDFENSTAYRYYRIYVTSTDSPAVAFTEIEFWNVDGDGLVNAYDSYGSDLTSGETASASTVYSTPTYLASKAIDDNTGTMWASVSSKVAHWWQCQFASATRINKLTLLARNDGWHEQAPTGFTVSASNTGAFGGEETELPSNSEYR